MTLLLSTTTLTCHWVEYESARAVAESVIGELGSQGFIRIRIGIGRPSENVSEDEIIGFVLSNFTLEEERVIKKAIARVSDAILCLIAEGLETAMSKYN